jgi:hypothetical protein
VSVGGGGAMGKWEGGGRRARGQEGKRAGGQGGRGVRGQGTGVGEGGQEGRGGAALCGQVCGCVISRQVKSFVVMGCVSER